jgi:hypothetical protein
MPTRTLSELQATLDTFRSLLDSHEQAKIRLMERRAQAAEASAVRIDRLLAMNEETAGTLRRTISALEQQLRASWEIGAGGAPVGAKISSSRR